MKLDKELKQSLIGALSHPYGMCRLMCDGFKIDLQVQRGKGMTYRIATYVNGVMKGTWMSASDAHPEQKFLKKVTKPLLKPREKAGLLKILGKRAAAKDAHYNATFSFFDPTWPSGRAVINHLEKVCESIEPIEV